MKEFSYNSTMAKCLRFEKCVVAWYSSKPEQGIANNVYVVRMCVGWEWGRGVAEKVRTVVCFEVFKGVAGRTPIQ